MVFRAIFWIGIVALLLPRAPMGHSLLATTAPRLPQASASLVSIESGFLERLMQIRSDIEAQQRARAARSE